jgi:hypothetical protein
MRKSVVLLILLLVLGTISSRGANNRFFITTSANNQEALAYIAYFEAQVFNGLKKDFPCVEINSLSTVTTLLEFERQKQLLGSGSEDAISNIAEAMGSDYLISLKVQVIGGTAIIDAYCASTRKANVVSRSAASAPHGGQGLNAVLTVAHQLINGLSHIEICPFTGPVSITLNSVLDSIKTVDYDVYCNEMDQRYHQKLEINNNTFSDWKLQRQGIFRTEGTLSFYSNEIFKTVEENGCYKCRSGREGGRTYTQTRSMKVKGNGISHESTYKGKPQDDTRIELKFLENGTYLLIAKGTSKPATGEEKVVSSAVGTCDNMPQETKTVLKEITIPLKLIFGPYEGKTTDKLLQQRDTKVFLDPLNKEKTTVTIDFSLTQKGKTEP